MKILSSPINIKTKNIFSKKKKILLFNHHLNISKSLSNKQKFFSLNNKNINIILNNQYFFFYEIHFHSPSEHTILNRKYNIEMHIVFRNNNNKILVIAIFLNNMYGLVSKNLENLLYFIKKKEKKYTFCIKQFLYKKYYYNYNGSLTTYPYTENVEWIILKDTIKCNEKIISFIRTISLNSRNIQKTNNRRIYLKKFGA